MRKRDTVNLMFGALGVVALAALAGCEEHIVRDSRFSTFLRNQGERNGQMQGDWDQKKDDEAGAAGPGGDEKPLPAIPQIAADSALAAYNLTQFAGQRGYTLQVGFYSEDSGRGFRHEAEKFCTDLRAKGVEAYFYHGPVRSLITVGRFTDADLITLPDGQTDYGPRIVELQKQFPYNLDNGVPVKLVILGHQQPNPEPSFIVKYPPAGG